MDAVFRDGAPGWLEVSAFAHAVWSCDIDPRAPPPTASSPVAQLLFSAVAWVAGSVAFATGQRPPPPPPPPPICAPQPTAADAVIERQVALLRVPPGSIRNPLPLDTTSGQITLMPQLLGSWGPDLGNFAVTLATAGGEQRGNVVVGSAATGVGKTHLAYAWGAQHGYSIIGRAITSHQVPSIAPPFLWLLRQLQPLRSVPPDDAFTVSSAASLFVRLTLLSFVHFSVLALRSLLATHPEASVDNLRQLLLRMHRNGNADALVTDILASLVGHLRVKQWHIGGSDIFVLDPAKMRTYEVSLSTAATEVMGHAILLTIDEAHELMERPECRAIASLFLSQRAVASAGPAEGAPKSLASAVQESSVSRSLFYAVVGELSNFRDLFRWSVYVTGTALSMRRIAGSSSASIATRCHPREFAPEHRLAAADIASILQRHFAIDDVLADATVSERLCKFVGRPQLFVAGVFEPLFDQIFRLRRLPDAAEFAAALSHSFSACVLSRKEYFIEKMQLNPSVASDGSGTMTLIPMLFKAAVMNDGVITLSDSDQLAAAICTGLLAVSSARGLDPVDMSQEPVIYEGMRAAMLDPLLEGRVLDVLVRSSQPVDVFAKGGGLELAISWHVALTCNRFADPSLAKLLETLGVPAADVPPDLESWVVRATRVRDDELGRGHTGAGEPSPLQRYFFKDSGAIDDSHVIFNTPSAMGGDVAFVVSRELPAAVDPYGGDIFSGRQYKPVVLQCKNEVGAAAAETLLTLHPGTQFLQNSARMHLLHLSNDNASIAPQHGWDKWEALARDAGKAFLTRNWVRVAVVARPLDAEIPAFSLAAATSDTRDAHVLAWTVAQRQLAALSPVVWVSLAAGFAPCPGVFSERVRSALVPPIRRARISLLHHNLWIPASVGDAARLLAQAASEAAAVTASSEPLAGAKRGGGGAGAFPVNPGPSKKR